MHIYYIECFCINFSWYQLNILIETIYYFIWNLAQVTQWGLILHGTEKPAQPNDPPSFDFPQPDANFLSEIDQHLDFDQTETGQWRNVHQVNEDSHRNIYRQPSYVYYNKYNWI